MAIRWLRLENYYRDVEDGYVFYPHLYAPGYRVTADERAAMDRVLGPFLNGRLWIEFIAAFCPVTFSFVIATTGFLVTASNEQLEAVIATPPWVWLLGAVALAGVVVVPIVFRLRSKIRRQLDEMGLRASEPPRPDFFMVDGKFSPRRLFYVVFAMGAILVLIGSIGPAGAIPAGL